MWTTQPRSPLLMEHLARPSTGMLFIPTIGALVFWWAALRPACLNQAYAAPSCPILGHLRLPTTVNRRRPLLFLFLHRFTTNGDRRGPQQCLWLRLSPTSGIWRRPLQCLCLRRFPTTGDRRGLNTFLTPHHATITKNHTAWAPFPSLIATNVIIIPPFYR